MVVQVELYIWPYTWHHEITTFISLFLKLSLDYSLDKCVHAWNVWYIYELLLNLLDKNPLKKNTWLPLHVSKVTVLFEGFLNRLWTTLFHRIWQNHNHVLYDNHIPPYYIHIIWYNLIWAQTGCINENLISMERESVPSSSEIL